MDEMTCTIKRIHVQKDNGWTVASALPQGANETETIVGTFVKLYVGAQLHVVGTRAVHPIHGQQFLVNHYEEIVPATTTQIKTYLCSGQVAGIGDKMAKRIVDYFGNQTLDVLDNHPERLTEVDGIGPKKAENIRISWLEGVTTRNIMIFLQTYGVTPSQAKKIYKQYGHDSIAVLKKNPYVLAEDIWGIGFRTSDNIAKNLGVSKSDPHRLISGVAYTLSELATSGHCYATRPQLLNRAAAILEIDKKTISEVLNQAIIDHRFISEVWHETNEKGEDVATECIYLPYLYKAETEASVRLMNIVTTRSKKEVKDEKSVAEEMTKEFGIEYNERQRAAIETAAHAKVMVLTGGPGTGKSTVTNAIIRLYMENGLDVRLAAPTGRAAKRMTEICSEANKGIESKTIHRLLEYNPQQGFARNRDNPIDGDALILDECSMIDTLLLNSLLEAIPPAMRVVLIGDIDQLPSVGPGNILNDIINSCSVPVIRLEEIFRQARGSAIVTNAHRINHGQMPLCENKRDGDFFFLKVQSQEDALALVQDLVTRRLPAAYKVNPVTDIQVLSPMRKGVVGTHMINAQLQNILNPPTKNKESTATQAVCADDKSGDEKAKDSSAIQVSFRVGDKVMQIHNNYDKGIYNGDIGIVEHVLTNGTIYVMFDNRLIEFASDEQDELVLSYACTIHKSQGSEYPIVILPIMNAHFIMLQRNLLYTGITRAKKLIILIGETEAIQRAVKNNVVIKRNTRLCDRLKLLAADSAA